MSGTSLTPLTIEPSEIARAEPGRFEARVAGDRLLLAADVAASLRRLSVRDTDELLSYLVIHPSAVASALRWSIEEVERARRGLVAALEGKVDAELLAPTAFDRPLGALPPRSGGEP